MNRVISFNGRNAVLCLLMLFFPILMLAKDIKIANGIVFEGNVVNKVPSGYGELKLTGHDNNGAANKSYVSIKGYFNGNTIDKAVVYEYKMGYEQNKHQKCNSNFLYEITKDGGNTLFILQEENGNTIAYVNGGRNGYVWREKKAPQVKIVAQEGESATNNVAAPLDRKALVIDLPKPGKLKSELKNTDLTTITDLQLRGVVNNADLKLLTQMPNLEKLDLSHVIYNSKDYGEKNGRYIESDYTGNEIRLTMPVLAPSVKYLILASQEGIDYLNSQNSTMSLKDFEVHFDEYKPSLDYLSIYATPNAQRVFYDMGSTFNIKDLELVFLDGTTGQVSPEKSLLSSYQDDSEIKMPLVYPMEDENLYQRNEMNKLTIHRLILPSLTYVNDIDRTVFDSSRTNIKRLYPFMTVGKNDDKIILHRWTPYIKDDELAKVVYLTDGAFAFYPYDSITIPSDVRVIPERCFYMSDKLKNIDLANSQYVSGWAFEGTAIEELSFPPSVKGFSDHAFDKSNIKKVSIASAYPLEIYRSNNYYGYDTKGIYSRHTRGSLDVYDVINSANIDFFIPQGKKSNYDIGLWKKLKIKDPSVNSDFKFEIKTPGTLSSFITDDIAGSIESLTLKGFLYDSDFEVIRKCKNLTNLDMTNCFITLSPSTVQAQQGEKEAMRALFGLVFSGAAAVSQNNLDLGVGDISDAFNSQIYGAIGDELLNDNTPVTIANDKCIWPDDALRDLKYIKKVAFPKFLKKVAYPGIDSKTSFDVVFPPALEVVGGMSSEYNPKELKFPSSLNTIWSFTISGSDNLESIDLSETQVTEIAEKAFYNCPNVKIFKAPKNLQKVGDESLQFKNAVGYFYTKEMPDWLDYSGRERKDNFSEIHIPRGCKAGWTKMKCKIIDDIDL